jgi:predicted permease
MISELRYVIRSLRRRKGFSLVTVLTLALGIGAATAIYSLVDWILFHPIPSPKDVYVIGGKTKEYGFNQYTFVPHYEAYSAQKSLFSDYAACTYSIGNIVVDRDPVANGYISVTPHFLTILGVTPGQGRNFTDAEGVEGKNDVVILAYGFWKKNLGGSAAALGRTILVDQQPCTVIGILKQDQRMPPNSAGAVYRPLPIRFNPQRPWEPYLLNYGKARPGFTRATLEDALGKVKLDLPSSMSWASSAETKPSLIAPSELQQWNRPELRWMMLGAVGFLYAIACLNATNLMLVHMFGKQREISVRLALGGSRWRIVRLLGVEAMGLCLCGSALGAVLANFLIPYFNAAGNGQSAALDWTTWHLNWRTYTVLGGLTAFTALVITFVPAIQVLRSDIQAGLKSGGGSIGESPRLSRLRSIFVVLQATFAMILLIGAGLMVQSFKRLDQVKIGYNPLHRAKLTVAYPKEIPEDPKERTALLKRLQSSLTRVPGVTTVAYSSESLMAQYDMTTNVFQADGVTKLRMSPVYISEDYQEASGISLKSGKWMTVTSDDAMVNETFARLRFGREDPVGQFVKPEWATGAYKGWHVVGVVGDIHEKVREAPGPKVYLPISMSPDSASNFILEMTSEPNGDAEGRIRQAVYQFDPRIVIESVSSITQLRNEQLRNEHLVLTVLDVLAGIAIVLTIVGMFSVLAYTVDRRMPEFGIRMALGARPSNLMALVMRRGIALTSIGIVIGIAGTLGLTRFLQTLLFETPPNDAFVIGGVAALLILSASAACILPAIKASKPDLLKLLKSD